MSGPEGAPAAAPVVVAAAEAAVAAAEVAAAAVAAAAVAPQGGRRLAGYWAGRAGASLRLVAQAARLMVGVHDHARYVEHMRTHHPELPVLDKGAYCALLQQRRYGGGTVGKCPC